MLAISGYRQLELVVQLLNITQVNSLKKTISVKELNNLKEFLCIPVVAEHYDFIM